MLIRSVIAGACLLAAPAALAQPADQKAGQNALNWEIFQKLYPKRAIAAREEGAVGFVVDLDSKGEVTRCKVTHSSGHPLLDEETCQLVTLHAQFTPDPALGPSQTKSHQGLIAWSCLKAPPRSRRRSPCPFRPHLKKCCARRPFDQGRLRHSSGPA